VRGGSHLRSLPPLVPSRIGSFRIKPFSLGIMLLLYFSLIHTNKPNECLLCGLKVSLNKLAYQVVVIKYFFSQKFSDQIFSSKPKATSKLSIFPLSRTGLLSRVTLIIVCVVNKS